MIIDTHIHLGGSRVTPSDYTESQLLETHEKWGVDVSLVLPLPHATPSPEAAHDRVYRLTQDHPGRFYGVMELSPSLEDEPYWKEAERCFRELGFVGMKLHTNLQPCDPLSPFADKVFEVAKHFSVPVIVHTGSGIPYALPALLISRARQFPEVSIVLAHAGNTILTPEAIIAGEVCDNIFLEPSFCSLSRTRAALKKLGSSRIMFGSDGPGNVPIELTKYRALGLSDSQLEDCLSRTAARVFRLPMAD